jgi:lipopolysaccharide export LptBFGC system permease protein LptF
MPVMQNNSEYSPDTASKRTDILEKARGDGLKLLKEEKKEWKKLRKERLKQLKKARETRQLNLVIKEDEKIKRHKKYFRHKIITAFRLWCGRIKEKLKNIASGRKVPDIEPEEGIDVKNVSEPKLTVKIPLKQRKLKKEIMFIEDEIKELNKPMERIEEDIKSKKKDMKKILSPKIYQKTKELIRLEEREKRLWKELDGIRNTSKGL